MPATTVTDPCGPTHFHGCACHEARWQERLAASEARAEKAISDTVQEFGLRRAAEARVRALEEGIRAAMDCSGNRWSEWGERAENVADMLDALLAPPPEAEKNGGNDGR